MSSSLVGMPKYDGYKDSGVEWLGEVPAHWELSKLGTCLKPVSVKNRPDLPLLSITRELGVIQRDIEDQDENHNYIPEDLSNYKILERGQFGMNKMKAWQGSYGVSDFTGIVSPAYFIFNFAKEMEPRFFHLAIRSRLYISFFGSASDGVRIGQWDLSKPRMKEIPFLIPPREEQTAIAAFLDRKTAQIDQAVAIKEQQIALLKERKQILIQNAVTRGLTNSPGANLNAEGGPKGEGRDSPSSPDAPMRDSGVEWIGEIPAHWEVSFARYLFRVVKRNDRNGTEAKFSVTQKRGLVPTDEMEEASTQASSFDGFQLCHEDDLVLNKYKAHLGVFWRAPGRGIVTNNYTVFKPLKYAFSKYYEILFHTHIYQSIFRTLVYGVTEGMMPLYTNDFYSMKVVAPPFDEQMEIVTFIERESAKIDKAIDLQQQQIDRLKEYKDTLINSAVTGKIKVPQLSEDKVA